MQVIFAVLILAFGVVQLYAGYVGIEYQFGFGWAVATMVATFLTRSSLLIIVGSFLCAHYVWDWHWFWAGVFAAPGLALILPALMGGLWATVRSKLS
jgi:hypothetical protein